MPTARPTATVRERPAAVEERLAQRIVDGDRQGLEADLDEALAKHPPLDIINVHLLAGMKVVGELFGAGKMQLPFVLQSAETMKAAVAYLEPHMERVEGSHRGTVVLATVKGDVHDIGKNLVDIILTNNGYRVVNLGIKQPLANILAAAEEHRAHAIGMSGLLVKSTVVMRDNMVEMTRQGLDLPVMLGGAALTRQFVEQDCVRAYAERPGRLRPRRLRRAPPDGPDRQRQASRATSPSGRRSSRRGPSGARPRASSPRSMARRPRSARSTSRRAVCAATNCPTASRSRRRRSGARSWSSGCRSRRWCPISTRTCSTSSTGATRRTGAHSRSSSAWAAKELRPILAALVEEAEAERVFAPQAVYGYWPAAGAGNDVMLFDPADHGREVARFALPRQAKANGLCIADFLRDAAEPERDVLGLQVVTIGQRASEVARAWFAADRYNDYVRLHGLGVELAEALAEYVHKRIRAELGFSHLDARERHELLKQGYRGSRYSFGYPACPNLADQRQLLALLDASRIGIELSDEDQLHPEQSTSAIVLHHPQARYFNV